MKVDKKQGPVAKINNILPDIPYIQSSHPMIGPKKITHTGFGNDLYTLKYKIAV